MLPSDFFRRNIVLSFQEDAIGIRLRDPRCVERLGRFRGCTIAILQLLIDGKFCITCLEEIIDLILIIVVVLLVFGGGGYWGYSRWR